MLRFNTYFYLHTERYRHKLKLFIKLLSCILEQQNEEYNKH